MTGRGWEVDEAGSRLKSVPDSRDIVTDLPYFDSILQPATFWRRGIHRPLRDELHYAFDWQAWLEMRRAGVRFHVVPEEWAAYRIHGVNKTAVDPARRRGEIADILREEWGRSSVHHLWARGIHGGFALAEATGLRPVKSAFAVANTLMGKLTRRRLFSS